MMLTPTEMERIVIFTAAEMARRRRARGLKLNHPEAQAYICDALLEGAREGRPLAELAGWGATLLTTDDVMPGVRRLTPIIQVEGLFPDGAKLITVHDPIRPGRDAAPEAGDARPGETIAAEGDVALNAGPAQGGADGAQHRRPPGPGRQPLPFLRGQRGAGVRPRGRLRHAPRHSRRRRPPLRAGREPRGGAGGRSAGAAW